MVVLPVSLEKKRERKLFNINRMLTALAKHIERYQAVDPYMLSIDHDAHCGSIINKFTLLFDAIWRYFKLLIEHKHGEKLLGARDVFAALHELAVISAEEFSLAKNMIADRNDFVHEYDPEHSNQACEKIIADYRPLFLTLLQRDAPFLA